MAHADRKGGNCNIYFSDDNLYATKYLRNTSSKEKIDRFIKELKILDDICRNPIDNIVQVIEVNIDEVNLKNSYIKMKKYDGSLYDILDLTKGNVKFSLELILPIIKVLKTLSEKEIPIYHRDIKPDNILFEKTEEKIMLYLSDFGACYLKDDTSRITNYDIAVGPRMFIAPEFEKGRVDQVNEKGDIFSLGKTIWFMINGDINGLMPSNFWFIDEYDLTKKYPNNLDMIIANTIIASCLNIDPNERCNYDSLIKQIENILCPANNDVDLEKMYRVKQYQEKRKIELLEIQQKNRLLVNQFSILYLETLEELINIYSDFDLLKFLYSGYLKKKGVNNDFTTVNIINNTAHYLWSGTHDRIYVSIEYNPAREKEKYCNITFYYSISGTVGDKIKLYYDEKCQINILLNNKSKLFNKQHLKSYLEDMIIKYVS